MDVRQRDLDFDVNNYVFLNVSPMKGAKRFGKKGKLNPNNVGPCWILERVGNIFYELKLSTNLDFIYLVFKYRC